MISKNSIIGIIGAGAMGSGIAQVAASAGHQVKVFDVQPVSLAFATTIWKKSVDKLVEKNKISQITAAEILERLSTSNLLSELFDCNIIIEAVVENLEVKQKLFIDLENIVAANTILASNTSSLSITSIAAACQNPERVIGIHFFNPATIMPLVEIIPALQTNRELPLQIKNLIDAWGKVTVIAKDTPGFIVNRVARSYYGEAIRIYEEGIANIATIDWAMKTIGGFKMGPFELMDMIGNDVNYMVTKTVWEQMFFDSRYKPSLTQKRLYEAKRFGKKTGQGYYNYAQGAEQPIADTNSAIGNTIFMRILSMLINEAIDTLYMNVADKNDIDLAITKGVNYPKGLLQWCDDLQAQNILNELNNLHQQYREERYRPSILLQRMAESGKRFMN